ncbi:MAG TPA: YfhO family protein [Chitinophagales bacterium]|nr:YfhO family protein [Chitinophagales bacterium]
MRKKISPLLLVIVPLLALAPLWIHARAMAFDVADYFLPQRYFLGECLRHGIFPWWNPYSGLGIPFHVDPQSGAFYPIAWIIGFFFGYDFYTINWEYLLHIMIAGWGMYRLMLSVTKSAYISLCTAIAYQLCGVFIGNAQHLSWIISAAWLPWVIFYWKKIFVSKNSVEEYGTVRDAIATALCLMMMTTGGYPAFIIELIYVVVICSIVFAVKKFRNHETPSLKKFFLLNLLLTGCYAVITAPYIVSFIKALPYFTRAAPLKMDPAFASAFTPQSIVSFLFPAATLSHTTFFRSDVSMINGYIGLLPLIILITLMITRQQRTVWILFFSSCLMLMISFGGSFFIWNVLFRYVPLIDHIRFAASFRLFAIIGFLIVAGMVMNNPESYRRAIHASVVLLIVILAAAVFSYLDEHRIMLPENFSVDAMKSFTLQSTITNNILLQSFLQASFAIAFIFIFSRRARLSQPLFHSLLVMIVCADMGIATLLNSRVTVFGTHDVRSLNTMLKQQPKGFPISMEKNLTDVTHEGDGSFSPSYYNNNLFKKQFAWNSYNPFDLNNKDSLDDFPKKHVLLHHPLVFISDQLQTYPSNYRDTAFTPLKNSVLVSKNYAEKFSKSNRDTLSSEISIQHFTPNEISFTTKSSGHAIVTLLQNYYPGWKATIDDKSTPIEISNYSTMSLALPEGLHQVTFEYDPGIIRWLFWLSIASQLTLLTFLFTTRKKFNSS